jgi:hypothetical protein
VGLHEISLANTQESTDPVPVRYLERDKAEAKHLIDQQRFAV